MNSRKFNAIMPPVHEIYMSQLLNMSRNPSKGVDLISSEKIVEVKFGLVTQERGFPKGWTVQDHQVHYPNGSQAYWALGFCWLKNPVSKIQTTNQDLLESLVFRREIYIINWDWMFQFPVSVVEGETPKSKWKNYFRYSKFNCVPRVYKSFDIPKGKINFTRGVSIDKFDF